MSDFVNDNVEEVSAIADTSSPRKKDFYRAIWRRHFYAGLFVVPFMLMLSVTGIIYLFKPQLDQLCTAIYCLSRPPRKTSRFQRTHN